MNDGIEEVWVPLLHKGFEDTHEVSNLGNVRSFFATQKNKNVPYLIKSKVYEDNILVVRVHNQEHKTIISVAYEVLKAFGFLECKGSIVYKDGIRSHCNLSNLSYTTREAVIVKRAKKESINKPIYNDRSCKGCVFYKCFNNQDDGKHFNTDYAKIGCFKYKQAV